MIIPVGEWMPDQPEFGTTQRSITAKNVIPWASSYKSVPSLLTVASNALNARCQGAYFTHAADGAAYNFAGTVSKLYQLVSGNSYSDVTAAAGAYSTPSDAYWEFAQWGQTVIAVNNFDAPQRITLGATAFAALAGSPPVAAHLDIVRDFVVLGNISTNRNRVQWSAFNNSDDWTVSAATQSDYQDLQDESLVQRVVGGEYGLIFQEHSIWRMTYVGPPVIFQFDKIEHRRGCLASGSVVRYGSTVFYLSDDGFYMTNGSGPSVSIGDGKVDKTFLDDLTQGYAYRVTGVVDPINRIVMWAYPGSGSSGGMPNKILCYNFSVKRWSLIEQECDMLSVLASLGFTLDQLDALGTLDALGDSLDSRLYAGGAVTLAAFNASHFLGTFTGTAMGATVDTIEQQHFAGRRAHVTAVRPLVDGNAASIAIGTRDRLADSESFTNDIPQSSDGVCYSRSNARYHRYRITTSGAFDFIQGVDVTAMPGDLR